MPRDHKAPILNPELIHEVVNILLPHLENKSFIDIGARDGFFTKFMAAHKFRGALFEPLPRYKSSLQKLAKRMGYYFAPFVMGDADETTDFILDDLQENVSLYAAPISESNTKTVSLTCRKLNTLLEQGAIKKKIGLIKINTNGNDLNVLRGMSDIEPEILICDYSHSSISEQRNPLKLIKEAEKFGFENFITIKNLAGHEIFNLNINAFLDKHCGTLVFINNNLFHLAKTELLQLLCNKENKLIESFINQSTKLNHELQSQKKICLDHIELIKQQNTELVSLSKKNERNEILLNLKEIENKKDKQLLALKETEYQKIFCLLKSEEEKHGHLYENSFEAKNIKLKCEIEKLQVELQQKDKTIQKLKLTRSAHDVDFLRDINIHFTEIFKRFTDIQQQIVNTSKEATYQLHRKYTHLQREKISFIEPLRNQILELFPKEKESWLRNKRAGLSSFLVPKLGELNLYPPRAVITPKHYHKKLKNKKVPSVSIVTPSFNHAEFIEDTIKSVLDQNYPHLEYIIQDGNSKDNTVNIIKKYEAHLKHWESIPDNGQSSAINLGFRHATGEIMAYLNSDDLLLPGTLNYIGHFFRKNPNVDVVYGHRILIDEDNHEIGRWVLPTHDHDVLSWADYIPQETLFWRRSIWDKVGGRIDESFRFAMDWDLILRFRDAGAKFVRLPRFLGSFRVHPHQKTSSQISNTGEQEMQRLRQRCHGRSVNYQEVAEATRNYLRRHLLFHRLYRLGVLRY